MFTETAVTGIATFADASSLVTSSSSHTSLVGFPLALDKADPIIIEGVITKTFYVWFQFEGGYMGSLTYHLSLICGLEIVSVT